MIILTVAWFYCRISPDSHYDGSVVYACSRHFCGFFTLLLFVREISTPISVVQGLYGDLIFWVSNDDFSLLDASLLAAGMPRKVSLLLELVQSRNIFVCSVFLMSVRASCERVFPYSIPHLLLSDELFLLLLSDELFFICYCQMSYSSFVTVRWAILHVLLSDELFFICYCQMSSLMTRWPSANSCNGFYSISLVIMKSSNFFCISLFDHIGNVCAFEYFLYLCLLQVTLSGILLIFILSATIYALFLWRVVKFRFLFTAFLILPGAICVLLLSTVLLIALMDQIL